MTKKKPIFPDEEATILHTDMENNLDTGVGSEDKKVNFNDVKC